MSKQDKSFKESLKPILESFDFSYMRAVAADSTIDLDEAFDNAYDAIIELVERDIIGKDDPADSNGRYNLKIEQRKALKS